MSACCCQTQGERGAQGPAGLPGAQGPQGSQGSAGSANPVISFDDVGQYSLLGTLQVTERIIVDWEVDLSLVPNTDLIAVVSGVITNGPNDLPAVIRVRGGADVEGQISCASGSRPCPVGPTTLMAQQSYGFLATETLFKIQGAPVPNTLAGPTNAATIGTPTIIQLTLEVPFGNTLTIRGITVQVFGA